MHDLVDNVTVESMLAGRNAGLYALDKLVRGQEFKIIVGEGINPTDKTNKSQSMYFSVPSIVLKLSSIFAYFIPVILSFPTTSVTLVR